MKRGSVVMATGNHRQGYNGRVVMIDADGKEIEVWKCDHRHQSTAAARTCATMRGRR